MNSFLELAKERCSVRAFKSDLVEAEKLDYILEAARMAPSAVNKQPWKIYMITPESAFELREKVQRCYDREWFKTAPYYLILCIEHDQSWHRVNGIYTIIIIRYIPNSSRNCLPTTRLPTIVA